MKLSKIVAAGLLGTSVLLFSGCSADPEQAVKDLTDELLGEISAYSVILVNGTDANITFTGVSRETDTARVRVNSAGSLAFNGAIDVSYPGGSTVTFPKGRSHVYVATDCNGHDHLNQSEDENRLKVVNLTGGDFTAGSVLIRESTTSTPVSGALYKDCEISSTDLFNDVVFTYDTEISTDGGVHYKTIRQIDDSFVNVGDEMKYCLVAYDDGNLSFSALAKIDLTQLNVQP